MSLVSAAPLFTARNSRSASSFFQIEQSLRFETNSATEMQKNFSVEGSRDTCTTSVWIKRGRLEVVDYCIWSSRETANFWEEFTIYSDGSIYALCTYNGATRWNMRTSALLRDPSAWYHLVYVRDTSNATQADRIRIYVNGVRIDSWATQTEPASQGLGGFLGGNFEHKLGKRAGYDDETYDGYMAEFHFLDGTARNADSFGEFDSNGVWRPIEYTGGGYGTNGLYLKFDPAATNGIGEDYSGNGHTMPDTSFTTSGTGTDVMDDTPMTNWCTINPLNNGTGNTENGNLEHIRGTGDSNSTTFGTFGVTSGKWYWEAELYSTSGGLYSIGIGFGNDDLVVGDNTKCLVYSSYQGDKVGSGSYTSYGASYGVGDIIGVALDLETQDIEFYKNGVSQGVAFTNISTDKPWFPISWKNDSNVAQSFRWNFGQREFAYPLGTASDTNYFAATAYTGNGTSQTITTGIDADLIWIKDYSSGTTDHYLIDTVRGVTKVQRTNTTSSPRAEFDSSTAVTAISSTGFTVGADATTNNNLNTTVAYSWNASAAAGFDIVTFTGNGANRTISHNCGAVPTFIMVKERTGNGSWAVYHAEMGNAQAGSIENVNAFYSSTTCWNSTTPTSSVFSLGTATDVNGNGQSMIAYLWADKDGLTKAGKYQGNGSSDGPGVEVGFRCAWVMIKRANDVSEWAVYDNATTPGGQLRANANDAENNNAAARVVLTNYGFKILTSDVAQNSNGEDYVYLAFAENFSADDSFKSLNTANLPSPSIANGRTAMDVVTYTGNGTSQTLSGLEFSPDLVWLKKRSDTQDNVVYDTTRGVTSELVTNSQNVSFNSQGVTAFNSDGFSVGSGVVSNENTATYVAWTWDESASKGFDIVSYTGNDTSGRTVSHSLGVKPDLMIVKRYSSGGSNWSIYHKDLGATKFLQLNGTQSANTQTNQWNDTEPTSTVFTVGDGGNVNNLSDDYIAYLFAEIEGYSKFGSYTGNGNADGPFVHTGFRSSLVIIKKTSGVDDWMMYDTARDPSNEVTQLLRPNTDSQESTLTINKIDILSNGFKLRSDTGKTNGNNDEYVFISFAENPFGGSGVSPGTAR